MKTGYLVMVSALLTAGCSTTRAKVEIFTSGEGGSIYAETAWRKAQLGIDDSSVVIIAEKPASMVLLYEPYPFWLRFASIIVFGRIGEADAGDLIITAPFFVDHYRYRVNSIVRTNKETIVTAMDDERTLILLVKGTPTDPYGILRDEANRLYNLSTQGAEE